eukprot:m.119908 g.119908  ORF g.119908 m.119908 type:complete len:322 (-) comp13321_c0_seq1:340-1305(-)
MSGGFSVEGMEQKLSTMSSSQQSVQTMSLWLIHHRKHALDIAERWAKLISTTPKKKQLTLLYLASDVILQSRKRGSELKEAFQDHLEDAFGQVYVGADVKTKAQVERIIEIWADRGAYTKEFCRTLKMALRLPSTPAHTDDAAILLEADPFAADKAAAEEVELPELLSVLQAAERSRSEHDALQRQVASISSEVFSEAAVAQLPDSVAVAIHEKKVRDARQILLQADAALEKLLEEKRKCVDLLGVAHAQQQLGVVKCQKRLNDFKTDLGKAKRVKRELKVHLSNLPPPITAESTLEVPDFTADDLLEALSPTSKTAPTPF